MKDDWTYDLKKRMADYGENPPEGLWDELNSALATAGKTGATRHTLIVRFARVAAIAAVVAILFMAGYFYDKHTHELSALNVPMLSETTGVEKIWEDSDMLPETGSAGGFVISDTSILPAESLRPAVYGQLVDPTDHSSTENEATESEPVPVLKTEQVVNEGILTGADLTPTREKTVSKRLPDPEPARSTREYRMRQAAHSVRSSGFGVGLYASNSVAGTDVNISSVDNAMVDSPGMSGMLSGAFGIWKNDVELFKDKARQHQEYRHHKPIRTGLSVSYALNDRLSVSTGLLYSRLTSDLEYDEGQLFCAGHRTLHYLGIPLTVNYRLYTWRNFDVYASAGTVAEKCVSGHLERRFFDNGELTSSESADVMETRWQVSVNAAAGVQLRLADHVGLYAEPGVGYYIDNGSDIDTYYKEKPLNLNFNIGLRVTVP